MRYLSGFRGIGILNLGRLRHKKRRHERLFLWVVLFTNRYERLFIDDRKDKA